MFSPAGRADLRCILRNLDIIACAEAYPFSIGEIERDQWLWCMNKALDESGFLPSVMEHLKTRFAEVADFMRNRAEK